MLIVARVEALAAFLDSDDGANLRAAYKRASNILRIEEKKDGTSYRGVADPKLFREETPEERALHDAIELEVPVAARFVDQIEQGVVVVVIFLEARENCLVGHA